MRNNLTGEKSSGKIPRPGSQLPYSSEELRIPHIGIVQIFQQEIFYTMTGTGNFLAAFMAIGTFKHSATVQAMPVMYFGGIGTRFNVTLFAVHFLHIDYLQAQADK